MSDFALRIPSGCAPRPAAVHAAPRRRSRRSGLRFLPLPRVSIPPPLLRRATPFALAYQHLRNQVTTMSDFALHFPLEPRQARCRSRRSPPQPFPPPPPAVPAPPLRLHPAAALHRHSFRSRLSTSPLPSDDDVRFALHFPLDARQARRRSRRSPPPFLPPPPAVPALHRVSIPPPLPCAAIPATFACHRLSSVTSQQRTQIS
ncbi:hypothetical protein B0H11DRAFT_2226355 [Mycena galericulata]|nr:hypothetical protein B0H11DRAFT_2226355 [Mycena galericulata]